MTNGERLQRIGELFAELMRSGDSGEKQGHFLNDIQETLASFAKGFPFPPGVVVLNKDGHTGLLLSIKTPVGSAVVYYDAYSALQEIFERLEAKANEEIDAIGEEEWTDDNGTGQMMASSIHSWMYMEAKTLTEILLKQLYFEFENTVKSLPEIALKLGECIRRASPGMTIIIEDDDGTLSVDSGQRPSFSRAKFINDSLEELNNGRKNRWITEVNSSVEKHNRLELLGFYFERVYPVWNQASKMYKESQKSQYRKKRLNWRKDILDELEKELKGFGDLLEYLAKKGSSAPSEIALRHAARLCGFASDDYTIRRLRQELARQGVSVKKVKSKL